MPTKLTTEILTAAIDGFEIQKARIDAQIAEIRQLLEGSPAPVVASEKPSTVSRVSTKRRKMSKAGRAAIAAAQRKRWADLKKEPAAAAAPKQKKKRKLSAAGRKAIIAATKKRWAAKRAEAAKQTATEA